MPPGLIVTSAAAICVERGKFCESTIRTEPPLLLLVGAIDFSLKVYCPVLTFCVPMPALSASRDGGSWPGKIYSGLVGKPLIVSRERPVFLASTSGGVCDSQEESSIVPFSEKLP